MAILKVHSRQLTLTEMHGCVFNAVATDALVLMLHQAISIHNADEMFNVLCLFHTKILHHNEQI